MTMNAITAASMIDYNSSFAVDPNLRTGIKARDIYRVGADIAYGRHKNSTMVPKIIQRLEEKELLSNLVFGLSSSGFLVGVCYFDPVFKFYSCDDFGELVKAA